MTTLNKIKVLWFSNTSANADEYFNNELKGTGGWLKSLDQALQEKVDLHISFYGKEDNVFKYKNTTYYSMCSPKGLLRKISTHYLGALPINDDLSKYLTIIDRVRPDIIHIHGTENAFGCILQNKNIPPVVVSIQGNITVIYHKFLSGYEKRYLNVRNRKRLSFKEIFFPGSFKREYNRFKKLEIFERKNLKETKFIIGRTDWDKRITRILAPGSYYFHGDEILRDSFYRNEYVPLIRHKIVIHTTNGNNMYKGFETLCLSLNELNRLGLDCEWRVAGICSSDLIVKLTKMKLKDKFPAKGLMLLGNLNEIELVNSLLSSDMYVMVSHIENSPNTLCEAMILGMPCISTFAGGVGSLLSDRKEGLLIQSGDPWAMAGAILELANDKKLAVELGKNARNVALDRHCKNRVVEELLNTYSRILDIVNYN